MCECVSVALMGGLHMEFAFGKHALSVMDIWTAVSLRKAGEVEAQHGGREALSPSSLPRPAPSTR